MAWRIRRRSKFNKYGQSGLEMSELFSHLGEHADDMCVIRSMYTGHSTCYETGGTLASLNTGSRCLQLPKPSMGSWVVYGLGSENQNMPRLHHARRESRMASGGIFAAAVPGIERRLRAEHAAE